MNHDVEKSFQYWDVEQGIVNVHSMDLSTEERIKLNAVNDRVGGLRSLEEALNYVFECTETMFPCDRLGVAFLEDEKNRIVTHWVRATYPIRLKKGYSETLSSSSLEKVIAKKYPRIIGNLEKYCEQKPSSVVSQVLRNEGVRSSMTCPLFVEEEVVGVLFRSSRQEYSYGPKKS